MTETTTSPGSGGGIREVGEIFADPDLGYMFKKAIEAVKAAVRIEDVAAEYGEFKPRSAGRLEGRCVAPDHEDRTPSLSIYTESGRFHCYGCGLDGDVVDLERVAGRHLEAWTAMRALAERYGVELPRRSERWHAWSVEKGRRRDALREVRARLYQKRLFRMFREDLERIEDPAEREEEARALYADLYHLARSCAERRADR
ncbi:MAG: CHC2 zinc finger domain-containing protein [Actinomycetota bacterium]|nr:CHC2 zinc finger domain-containing protein [Actinomycetota bacterium]